MQQDTLSQPAALVNVIHERSWVDSKKPSITLLPHGLHTSELPDTQAAHFLTPWSVGYSSVVFSGTPFLGTESIIVPPTSPKTHTAALPVSLSPFHSPSWHSPVSHILDILLLYLLYWLSPPPECMFPLVRYFCILFTVDPERPEQCLAHITQNKTKC